MAGGHHEHWDGSGYPQGLKGEEIPLEARIVAIVDSWVSLVNDRPWRKALGQAQALALVREAAGSHFDPRLAAIFVDMLSERDV